jgi:hypothetical protein
MATNMEYVSFQVLTPASMKLRIFWDVLAFIIRAMMMQAERISETSVKIQLRTRQYIPEDSELNMEYHYKNCIFCPSKSLPPLTDKPHFNNVSNQVICKIHRHIFLILFK